MDNKSMSDRNGKVVEEKVPLRRADTLKKNRWRKSGTEITSAIAFFDRFGLIRTASSDRCVLNLDRLI